MATTELSGSKVKETIVNYMITQLIFEDAQFLVPQMAKLAVEANYIPYAQRRGRGVRRHNWSAAFAKVRWWRLCYIRLRRDHIESHAVWTRHAPH
ncbi:hypothetical protein COOONC_19483 [Cooperia oncophora]